MEQKPLHRLPPTVDGTNGLPYQAFQE